MAKPRNPEVRRFYQAVSQRFDDAVILLDNDRTTGAIYLAGYAVECMLKALLLLGRPYLATRPLMKLFRGNRT